VVRCLAPSFWIAASAIRSAFHFVDVDLHLCQCALTTPHHDFRRGVSARERLSVEAARSISPRNVGATQRTICSEHCSRFMRSN
jgi:hypothetical protein